MFFYKRLHHSCTWLSLLVVSIASLLIIRADVSYNQTFDETAHIACGMEWLSLGTYNFEDLHPPLARTATALLLYMSGIRSKGLPLKFVEEGHPMMGAEGTAILNSNDAYRHNLLLARLGVLPFFWLSCLLIFYWMRRNVGIRTGLFAVLLFCFCPPVLAHYALATTDAPFMTMFLLSVISFACFLEAPSYRNGVLAGLSFALATLTKFTEIPFFFVTSGVLLTWYLHSGGRLSKLVRPLALGALAMLMMIWAGYRFSIGPLLTQEFVHPTTQARLARMSPEERAFFMEIKLPAPELYRGLYGAYLAGAIQRRSGYIFGHVYQGGKWYFFPIAVLSKTPLAVLLLSGVGLLTFLGKTGIRAPVTALLIAGIVGPMLIGMAGNLNLGLRHVLPIYPFLAMLAAVGTCHLWTKSEAIDRAWIWKSTPAVLVTWEVVGCLLAAPQFLPYFNEVAMPYYGQILVESDLDWGQDLYLLEARLENVNPSEIHLAYFGDNTIVRHNSGRWANLLHGDRPKGWIAVSETLIQENRQTYTWLLGRPFERIGRSIRLYYLPLR